MLALPSAASALTYVEKTIFPPGGTEGRAKAKCPKGTHVLGGGQYVLAADQQATLDTSAPYDGKDRRHEPDDGWVSSIRSFSSSNRLDVFAVCGGEEPSYVTHKQPVGGLEPFTGYSSCPARTRVLGGGASLPVKFDDDAWIETSAPGSAQINGPLGWKATGGVGERSAKMSITAICAKDKVKYETAEGTAPPNTYGEASATCPDGTQVTGGGVETSGLAQVDLTISSPFDSADPDTKPDNGWQGEADNYSTTNQAFVDVVAICRA